MFLLGGQPPDLETAIFKLRLCVLSNSHSYSRWSVVWSFLPHGHVGEVISLKRYRYDLMLPWPVIMVVRYWFVEILMFSLSATVGKDNRYKIMDNRYTVINKRKRKILFFICFAVLYRRKQNSSTWQAKGGQSPGIQRMTPFQLSGLWYLLQASDADLSLTELYWDIIHTWWQKR